MALGHATSVSIASPAVARAKRSKMRLSRPQAAHVSVLTVSGEMQAG
jgi:hypothetical protein